jgi:3-phenylpropionate/trans-cinnamate dioxygenase ferredoxin component
MEFIRLAGIAEVPEGEMRAYDTPAGRVAVAHVEHRLFAFSDDCTHAGCSLAEGEFDDREATVECACHGSVFDVETGEPVGGPAQDPVPVYSARLTDDGWVEVATAARTTDDDA